MNCSARKEWVGGWVEGGQCHTLAALPPEKTCTHCTRGWGGPRVQSVQM